MTRSRNPVFVAGACALALLVSALAPTPARAQLGIEDVLESVTDISVSGSCWSTRSESLRRADCPGGRNGYGLEVMWELKTIHLGRKPAVDTTWVESQKTVTVRQGRADTVTTLVMQEEEQEPDGWSLLIELALGYSQFSGFQSADDRYDLRGTVREQPSLAIYGSLSGPVLGPFSPYVGVRSGLVRLNDVSLFTPADADAAETTAYTGHAEVFQVGAALGLAVDVGPASWFVEGQLNLRRFPSVDWTAGAGGTLPGFLPRALDFSGPSLSVGLQIHIREPAESGG
jgi:hypothetical protein